MDRTKVAYFWRPKSWLATNTLRKCFILAFYDKLINVAQSNKNIKHTRTSHSFVLRRRHLMDTAIFAYINIKHSLRHCIQRWHRIPLFFFSVNSLSFPWKRWSEFFIHISMRTNEVTNDDRQRRKHDNTKPKKLTEWVKDKEKCGQNARTWQK